jgi:hypothetical protein
VTDQRWNEMTCYDENKVMKAVGIANLKAWLAEHLKAVRKGRTRTILDLP